MPGDSLFLYLSLKSVILSVYLFINPNNCTFVFFEFETAGLLTK